MNEIFVFLSYEFLLVIILNKAKIFISKFLIREKTFELYVDRY